MNNKIIKIVNWIAGLIGIITIFFLIRLVAAGDDEVINSAELQNSIVSPFLSFGTIILIVTTVLAIAFSIWNMIIHPKLLKRTLLSIALLAAVLVISYLLADGGAVTDVSGKVLSGGEAGAVSKWVSTGIWYTAILGLIGFGLFLVGFVKSLLKV
jgi:hypothetical protein